VADFNPFSNLFSVLGPSWSWSYGSWIYNCLCNQYLSPLLKLWVQIPFIARYTTLCHKDCQWIPSIKLTSTI